MRSSRTVAMERNLYRKIAFLLEPRIGLSDNDVVIVLAKNAAENWSFGRGEAQLVASE
jgi:4-oxalocrotonate tautomerase